MPSAIFSKQSILAPTAKIQPWWQAPKPPPDGESKDGATEEQVRQVPSRCQMMNGEEVSERSHETGY